MMAASEPRARDPLAEIRRFFGADGPLASTVLGYEPRAGQLSLALAVAEALLHGGKLVAEAGTGTGKTLAYLVPAILLGRRVLISTATKALQSQLLRDDVPSIAAALGQDVSVVTLKGRLNYLCERRAEAVFLAGSTVPSEAKKIAAVADWRRRTKSGDRAECSALGADDEPLWRRLTASSEQCLGRRCSLYDRCWLLKARERAEEAAITVVNHHLFFADAALQSRGGAEGDGPISLLPGSEALIFDEAHELADIATHHFGAQLDEGELGYVLRDVARYAVDNEQPTTAGLAAACQGRLAAAFAALGRGDARAPLELTASSLLRPEVQAAAKACRAALTTLADALNEHKAAEPQILARRLASTADQLALCCGLEREPACNALVRWREASSANDGESMPMRLVARPLHVAALMRMALADMPAVFVSATLRDEEGFGHIQGQLGAQGARELLIDSPFDWRKQAALYLPSDLPAPNTADFDALAAERAAELVVASNGGAFVLCTSRRAMESMRRALAARFAGQLLVQGERPKELLLADFVADGNAALVATLGFWRGVDVRGSALRLVVLDRIPFAPPGDPMVAARISLAEASGESGFARVQLPQATLLLRQGVGRLLRSSSDRGVVAILDPRLRGRSYGRRILQALPPCRVVTELSAAAATLAEQAS